MAIPQSTATTGTFFVTTITASGRRLFQVTRNAELYPHSLSWARKDIEAG